MRRLGIAGAVVALSALLSSCGWMQLGYNSARTSYNDDEKTLTADKLPQLREAWVKSTFSGANAPIVNDGVVYVTNRNVVTALRAGTGDQIWQKPITNAAGTPELSEPSVSKNRLLLTYTVRNPTSHVLAAGIVDFSLTDGSFNDVPLLDTEPRGIAVRDKVVAMSAYVTSGSHYGAFVKYGDPAVGTHTGELALDTPGPLSAPMILGNRVFVSHASSVYAFALDGCGETSIDTRCQPEWSMDVGGGGNAIAGMPVGVGADAIVVPVDLGRTHVLSTSGEFLWSTANANSDRGIAVANGVIYAAGADGYLRAYATAVHVDVDCPGRDCLPIWEAEVGGMFTAPVVAAGVVYVGATDGELRAYNANGCGAAACDEIWQVRVGGDKVWPIVWDGRLYTGANGGDVRAFKLQP